MYIYRLAKFVSLIVIQALTGKFIVPWKIGTIIDDIRTWLQQATYFRVTHIFREANKAADWLSKFGKSITVPFSSDVCFSLTLSAILVDDVV